ncbi:sugar phosphate isomerase/epimerase [Candidatus Bipolaricaulota bacterium]|nr:sugar phosphate isomerase/epimerase [Candidatus Bipolaricaulota bacterium]
MSISSDIEQEVSRRFNRHWNMGVSTLMYPHDPVRAINEIFETGLGLNRIEIGLGKPLEENEALDDLSRLKESRDIDYSLHVPFLFDDIAHPHPAVRRAFVDEALNSIDLAVEVGAEDLVIHPGYLALNQSLPDVKALNYLKQPREQYLENSISSLKDIARYNRSHDVTLFVENLPFGLCDTLPELKRVLNEVDGMSFILDVGHANVSSSLEDFLELEPSYLHLHDNLGSEDEHLRLGAGNLDFQNLFSRVLQQEGEKKMTLELYTVDDVVDSLELIKTVLGVLST